MSDKLEKTHELVRVGLQLVDKGVSISEAAIDEWMTGDEEAPFPNAEYDRLI